MRQNLHTHFDFRLIVDLHGDTDKKDKAADGSHDENVFDIKKGVCVALMSKCISSGGAVHTNDIFKKVDLQGNRQFKFEWLLSRSVGKTGARELQTSAPTYLFGDLDQALQTELENFFPVSSIFSVGSTGLEAGRDELLFDFSAKELIVKLKHFATAPAGVITEEFKVDEAWGQKLFLDRGRLNTLKLGGFAEPFTFGPFDKRTFFAYKDWLKTNSFSAGQHLLGRHNLSLIAMRQVSIDGDYDHAGVSRDVVNNRAFYSTKGKISYFPLWLFSGPKRVPSLSASFVSTIQGVLNFLSADYRPEDSTAPLHAEKIFHYIYAVLHSPAYRQRYAAFLRTDFPRIPIPGSLALFNALAALGEQLVQWHVLEHPDAIKIEAARAHKQGATAFFGTDFELKKVAEKGRELAEPLGGVGKVYINATSGFENVHQPIWQHTIGGYQVLHKWLDDRRKAKRSLNQDDITHWLRIYASLEATQKLMLQVDEAIEANGGWPGAFSQNHPPPDAATLAAEQMVQKEQLKAQKKAAASKKKSAASGTGHLNFGDDLDELAEASGAPLRPKARATPAKAAGGKASTGSARTETTNVAAVGITDWQAMCAIRAVLAREGALARQDLIRSTARELGFARTSPRIAKEIESAIRRAARRGIASNEGGTLSPATRKIEDYDRAFLKQHLLSCLTKTWRDKAEVPLRFARTLGFARTGPKIAGLVWSLVRSLQRGNLAEVEGSGVDAQYRKTKGEI